MPYQIPKAARSQYRSRPGAASSPPNEMTPEVLMAQVDRLPPHLFAKYRDMYLAHRPPPPKPPHPLPHEPDFHGFRDSVQRLTGMQIRSRYGSAEERSRAAEMRLYRQEREALQSAYPRPVHAHRNTASPQHHEPDRNVSSKARARADRLRAKLIQKLSTDSSIAQDHPHVEALADQVLAKNGLDAAAPPLTVRRTALRVISRQSHHPAPEKATTIHEPVPADDLMETCSLDDAMSMRGRLKASLRRRKRKVRSKRSKHSKHAEDDEGHPVEEGGSRSRSVRFSETLQYSEPPPAHREIEYRREAGIRTTRREQVEEEEPPESTMLRRRSQNAARVQKETLMRLQREEANQKRLLQQTDRKQAAESAAKKQRDEAARRQLEEAARRQRETAAKQQREELIRQQKERLSRERAESRRAPKREPKANPTTLRPSSDFIARRVPSAQFEHADSHYLEDYAAPPAPKRSSTPAALALQGRRSYAMHPKGIDMRSSAAAPAPPATPAPSAMSALKKSIAVRPRRGCRCGAGSRWK
jgi:hypothetical protein